MIYFYTDKGYMCFQRFQTKIWYQFCTKISKTIYVAGNYFLKFTREFCNVSNSSESQQTCSKINCCCLLGLVEKFNLMPLNAQSFLHIFCIKREKYNWILEYKLIQLISELKCISIHRFSIIYYFINSSLDLHQSTRNYYD